MFDTLISCDGVGCSLTCSYDGYKMSSWHIPKDRRFDDGAEHYCKMCYIELSEARKLEHEKGVSNV